jgi:hypothetical protein
LRVSSALKFPFGRGVRRSPSGYDPGRAFQRVQPGQTGLPTRTRRALRWNGIPSVPPRSGIQPTGYHHSRPTRRPGRGGVVLRLSHPAGCGREASVGVEDPVPQPGNAVRTQYERADLNDSEHNSRPATERWAVSHRVGFIPRLKPWAFASNNCNGHLAWPALHQSDTV